MEDWQSALVEHWKHSSHESSLPDGALILLYSVSIQPTEEGSNYKLRVDLDGRVFVARHSGREGAVLPVDAPFPAQPSEILDAAGLSRLTQALRDDHFAELPLVVGEDVEDGWYDAVFARTDRGPHFVISRQAKMHILDALASIQR